MGNRPIPFAPNEWYHCYSRSISGTNTFRHNHDYARFLESLYICNNAEIIERGRFQHYSHERIFSIERDRPLIKIAAYALMQNHFHILLQEGGDGGISKFMQRLGTSYGMYFNSKYKHIGNVFIRPFRAKHIDSDAYLRQIVPYIHLNPAEIFEPRFRDGIVRNPRLLEQKLKSYQYCSLFDYESDPRAETSILDRTTMTELRESHWRPINDTLKSALAYYQELS